LLDEAHKETLFDALQRKAVPEIEALLDSLDMSSDVKAMLLALAELKLTCPALNKILNYLKLFA